MQTFLLVFLMVPIVFSQSCLDCICKVESNCRPLSCKWDVNSLSCGYYQIKREYYSECGTPGMKKGESLDTAWKRCAANKQCSILCLRNYVKRWGHLCPGKGSCEKMARIHNGGPRGCQKTATLKYWDKVKKCCKDCS